VSLTVAARKDILADMWGRGWQEKFNSAGPVLQYGSTVLGALKHNRCPTTYLRQVSTPVAASNGCTQ